MTKSVVTLFGLVLVAAPLAGCGTMGLSSAPPASPAQPAVANAGPAMSNSPILEGLDPADRARAEQARASALNGKNGTSVNWKSAESSQRYGNVVAGPINNESGLQCRQYTQTVYLDGVPSVARATACRQPDGNWANS